MSEAVSVFPAQPHRAEATLWSVLWKLSDAQNISDNVIPMHPGVRQTLQAIEAQLGEPLSVLALAHACGLSHNHLTRSFRAAMGDTVVGYIGKRRMERGASPLDPFYASDQSRRHSGGHSRFATFQQDRAPYLGPLTPCSSLRRRQANLMEPESASVIKFLNGIADAHEHLQRLCLRIKTNPAVQNAKVYRYSPSHITRDGIPTLEGDFGVSAEMVDGTVVDWWLEVWQDAERWHIDYNIHCCAVDEEYSHIAIAFAEKQAETLDAFLVALSEAIQDLEAASWREPMMVTVQSHSPPPNGHIPTA